MREAPPQPWSDPARHAPTDATANGSQAPTPAAQRAPLPDPFCVEVRNDRDTIHVVPSGELDLATVGEVEQRLRELRDADFRCIVLDLRKLTFIDSTGLQLAMRWDAHAKRDGMQFSLITGSAAIQRPFEISGLHDQLTFRER